MSGKDISAFELDRAAAHPVGCACGLHEGPRLAFDLYGSADPLAGGDARGKPIWTAQQAADHLNRSGDRWYPDANGIITFAFVESADSPSLAPLYGLAGLTHLIGFSPFTEAQREGAREALMLWSDLANITFVETTDVESAQIRYMNTTTGPIQASAFLPFIDPADPWLFDPIAGDVFVNPNQSTNFDLYYGGYGFATLIHETGHALGLSHPGDYNFGPGFSATYANGAEYYQDSLQYSIMSYWEANETGGSHINWEAVAFWSGATPGVHDVLAIQTIYGTNTTTRTGDTIYGFNSTADRSMFDFTINTHPVLTIWDAGGNDTLDLSGYGTDSVIDLNPGAFSSASPGATLEHLKAVGFLPASYTQAQLEALFASYNSSPQGRMTDNISIAYGTWIENAVGGDGDDIIIANAIVNVLDGGEGFDTVSYKAAGAGVSASLASKKGLSGDAAGDEYISIEKLEGSDYADTLLGGNGHDVLSGLGGNDTLTGGNQNDMLDGGDGDDTLEGGNHEDILHGGDGNDTLIGGNHADLLGGGDGNDVLHGGNHNDRLDGGAGDDVLTGGNHDDVFVFSDLGGADVITDFRRGQDKIDLSGIDAVDGGGDDAFNWVGASAFSGTAGELRAFISAGSHFLAGDVDGDGLADFTVQTNLLIVQADLVF